MSDTQHHSKNRRILIIDDNRAIHEDFRKILAEDKADSSKVDDFEASLFGESATDKPKEDQTPFEIDSAFQGQEGLGLVRQSLQENRPYPMAFVDMRMPPGWDGVETISRIWEEYPDLQVVICTAYSDYSWDQMVKKFGNTDRLVVLKKPFDSIEVLQLTQTLTEKWQLSQETKRKISDLHQMLHERTEELKEANAALEAETVARKRVEEKLKAKDAGK
jgi:DNA-binding NtrC family response regulator